MSPRDTQRQRVYDAEHALFGWGQTIPNGDLQQAVNDILDKRPIRSRWGTKSVEVRLGRGGGLSSQYGLIWLGVQGRNPWVICHELAHELTPSKYAAHGPEFAGVMLFLIGTVMGDKHRKDLLAAYRANKVKRSNAAIPEVRDYVPPTKVELARVQKRKKRESALDQINRWVATGVVTKADLRRAADSTAIRRQAATKR